MTTPQKKILRVDELLNDVVGHLDMGGTVHQVLQPSLEAQQVMVALENAASPNDIDRIRQAVKEVVPSLTDEQIGKLNSKAAVAILHVSAGNISAVEEAFPNAVSPETAPISPG